MTPTWREMTLQDLLSDPLVRTLMARDGLDAARFEGLFRRVGHQVRPAGDLASARLSLASAVQGRPG